jgi:transcriptional regulator with XRE-family HTH domain
MMVLEQINFFFSVFNLQEDRQLKQREQLYAEGNNLSKLVNELILKLKENNGLTILAIAKKLQVSDKQLRAWKRGKSAVPLRVLKTLADELNIELTKIEICIDRISSSNGAKVIIPKNVTSKLIEIFGRFCGDGSCGIYSQHNNKTDYKFSFKEKQKEFVYLHATDMKTVFGIHGTVIDYGNHAENIIRSKPLVLFFMKIFEYKDNFNKSLNGKPPVLLRSLPWTKRKYFTTGLIDTEGCFYKSKDENILFTIKMINKHFIDEIKEAFDYFNITYSSQTYKEKKSTFYYVRVSKQNDISHIIEIFELKNKRHYDRLHKFGLIFG